MLKKNIWIINQYAGSPQTGNPGRHYHIAKEFQKLGYDVTLILATITHNRKFNTLDQKNRFFCENIDGINYVWIRTPEYKNTHGLGRIRNWFLFSHYLKKLVSLKLNKPDLIYYSSLSLVGYLGAEYLKKYFNIPLVFEIRDIWPLTLKELKHLRDSHPLVFFLRRIELKAYQNSDYIVSNLSNFSQYLDENGFGTKNFYWLPNGFDGTESRIKQEYINLPAKKYGTFRIGYTGSLGLANNMDCFIEVANRMIDHKTIEFYILGDGPKKSDLQALCKNENVHFLPKTSKQQVQSFLGQMDCCYIGWNDSKLYNYGIGANKFLDYMMSGKPIIHSYSGKGDPVEIFDLGITVNANDCDSLKKAILSVKTYNSERLSLIEKNSIKALNQFYDYNVTVKELNNRILGLL